MEEGGLERGKGGQRMRLELSEAAEWQFTDKELGMVDACTAVTARGETIACVYIRTQPDARYICTNIACFCADRGRAWS